MSSEAFIFQFRSTREYYLTTNYQLHNFFKVRDIFFVKFNFLILHAYFARKLQLQQKKNQLSLSTATKLLFFSLEVLVDYYLTTNYQLHNFF